MVCLIVLMVASINVKKKPTSISQFGFSYFLNSAWARKRAGQCVRGKMVKWWRMEAQLISCRVSIGFLGPERAEIFHVCSKDKASLRKKYEVECRELEAWVGVLSVTLVGLGKVIFFFFSKIFFLRFCKMTWVGCLEPSQMENPLENL